MMVGTSTFKLRQRRIPSFFFGSARAGDASGAACGCRQQTARAARPSAHRNPRCQASGAWIEGRSHGGPWRAPSLARSSQRRKSDSPRISLPYRWLGSWAAKAAARGRHQWGQCLMRSNQPHALGQGRPGAAPQKPVRVAVQRKCGSTALKKKAPHERRGLKVASWKTFRSPHLHSAHKKQRAWQPRPPCALATMLGRGLLRGRSLVGSTSRLLVDFHLRVPNHRGARNCRVHRPSSFGLLFGQHIFANDRRWLGRRQGFCRSALDRRSRKPRFSLFRHRRLIDL
jgi:hypothetical protein